VSEPASVAAFTAPTSPTMVTATRPSPTSSRPTMVTLAALTIASAAASAATYPLVSIIPIALSAIWLSPSCDAGCSTRAFAALGGPFLLRCGAALRGGGRRGASRGGGGRGGPGRGLVDGADDERVDRRRLAGKPGRRDRALGDQHPFPHPAAEHVERHQPGAAALGFDLQERAVRDLRQPPGGPDVPHHRCRQHQRSLVISTPAARALSLASGVSTARRPSTSRAPALAAETTIASVTAPFSTRWLGCTEPGTAGNAS